MSFLQTKRISSRQLSKHGERNSQQRQTDKFPQVPTAAHVTREGDSECQEIIKTDLSSGSQDLTSHILLRLL